MEEKAKADFLKYIGEIVDWIYAAGENASLKEYQDRLSQFKTIGEPVKKRYIFYSTVQDSFKRFEDVAEHCS